MKNTKQIIGLLLLILIGAFIYIYTNKSDVPVDEADSQTGQVINNWQQLPNMPTGVLNYAGTKLADGRVLIAGGRDSGGASVKSQIFNPSTNTWQSTPSMKKARESAEASLLSNGNVLVSGGLLGGKNRRSTNVTEIYNSAQDKWLTGPAMNSARYDHVAVNLPDGRVMMIGGFDGVNMGGTNSVEFYNPSTNNFSAGPSMSYARNGHSAILSQSGDKVFVIGGGASCSSGGLEIYNVSTNSWQAGVNMMVNRMNHEAIILNDGNILVAGGKPCNGSAGSLTAQAEIYNPTTNTWSLAGSTQYDQMHFALAKLPDGKILSVGGVSSSSPSIMSTNLAFVYDPMTNTWSTGPTSQRLYSFHKAFSLNNGKVLVAGGSSGAMNGSELYSQ